MTKLDDERIDISTDESQEISTGSGVVEVRVPTYKRPILLHRALSTLIAQTHQEWRCRVLDDEPGGGAAREVCASFGDKRILYEPNQRNLGVGANINQAFSMEPLEDSTHACVLEDDNYYLPDLLRSNLLAMDGAKVDVILRNQLIEKPLGRDMPGPFASSTTLEGQYPDSLVTREELWATFFYSTGANNSGLFWRLGKGLSFSTTAFTSDLILQERLRTLCIDRDIVVGMEPMVVWRDNGQESLRPRASRLSWIVAQTKVAARERRLYRALSQNLAYNGYEQLIWSPRFRIFDRYCERVMRRCGIHVPRSSLLDRKERLILAGKRTLAMALGWILAEPVRYRLDKRRIELIDA